MIVMPSPRVKAPRIVTDGSDRDVSVRVWRREAGAQCGFIVQLKDDNESAGSRVNWRFEWIRGSQTTGCKFEGYWRKSQIAAADFVSSFRLAPHQMGFIERAAGDEPTVELLLPGRFILVAWCSQYDAETGERLESEKVKRMFEIVYEAPQHCVEQAPRASKEVMAHS